MPVDRRTLLRLAGGVTTVSAASMAGCTGEENGGPSGGGAGGSTAYSQWLWLEENDKGAEGLLFVAVDWEKLQEIDATTGSNSERTFKSNINDPMLSAAAGGLILVGFAVGFGLFGTGLNGLTTAPEEGSEDGSNTTGSSTKTSADYNTSIDRIISANDPFVMLGAIDTEEIDTALSDGSLVKQDGFEEYTVYGPEQDDSDDQGQTTVSGSGSSVAFNEEMIVLFDTEKRDQFETLVATKNGESTRATDANSDLAWLIDTAGAGDIVFGGYGSQLGDNQSSEAEEGGEESESDSEQSSLNIESAVGVTSAMTFQGTSSSSASLAMQFDKPVEEIEQSKLDRLQEEPGSTADDRSISIDGNRLTATATWNGNALDNAYQESDSSSGSGG